MAKVRFYKRRSHVETRTSLAPVADQGRVGRGWVWIERALCNTGSGARRALAPHARMPRGRRAHRRTDRGSVLQTEISRTLRSGGDWNARPPLRARRPGADAAVP